MPKVQCKNCVYVQNFEEWCMIIRDMPDQELERECEHFLPLMPEGLSPFAVKLITRCPALINLFAEKINSMIYNWEHDEIPLEPITAVLPDTRHDKNIQDLISHVGYSKEQCGYDK